jgi:hypothetical protein
MTGQRPSTSFAQRVLQAYRPIGQHGLLIDGQYRRPATHPSETPSPRRRMLLVALCGVFRNDSSSRSSS